MAVEKVWKCDLCGEFVGTASLRRVGVRTVEDRPDAADWVDVGPCCHDALLSVVLTQAGLQRKLAENG